MYTIKPSPLPNDFFLKARFLPIAKFKDGLLINADDVLGEWQRCDSSFHTLQRTGNIWIKEEDAVDYFKLYRIDGKEESRVLGWGVVKVIQYESRTKKGIDTLFQKTKNTLGDLLDTEILSFCWDYVR